MQVRLTDVVKRFRSVEALTGVSLTISDGEFFTLLGPSGCGKTTTLRVIAGFYDPDSGTVFFDDVPMNGIPPAERGIGIVFQNYALWPHMTVFDNVAYGLRIQRTPAAAIATRVASALEQVGLKGLERRTPGQLSGGQQQRVAVARALVLNPRVLLLDEPLSNLDAKVRSRLRSEIRRLQQELRITTIYVTHDQEEALVLSDRIAVMDAGRVQQIGTPTDLYERPASLFVADFIGTNNFLSGTVVESADGYARVRTTAGLIHGRVHGAVREGMPATAAIRPENVVLADGALQRESSVHADNRLSGRVILSQYMGSVLRYEVDTAGTVLRIDIHDPKRHRPMAPGTVVSFSFERSVTVIYLSGREPSAEPPDSRAGRGSGSADMPTAAGASA
jgi:iron(III) transport system ATP-binding protein